VVICGYILNSRVFSEMISKQRAEELSKAYYEKVFRYCMAISKNNYHDAVEITQEVFFVFVKKLDNLEDNYIEHWLLSVAKKKSLEYYRRVKDEQMVISIEDSFTSAEEVLSTITKYYTVSDVELKLTIETITKFLTEDEYQLFVKKFLENKTQAQIAEEMGISVSNVSTRTARLRNKIEKLGFFCFTFVGQIIIKNFF
jgi:RNA polymerase sigma-70 factor (ECF subfamily)